MIYTMADLDVMHPGLYWKRAGWILYELREGGESGDNKIKLGLVSFICISCLCDCLHALVV